MRDSSAGKDLLYRRTRSLVDYENANKALEKARTKNKEVALVRYIIDSPDPQVLMNHLGSVVCHSFLNFYTFDISSKTTEPILTKLS